MLPQLPEQADPRRLCVQGKRFEGRVALNSLDRLAPLLTSSEGEAAFQLVFDQDERKRSRVRGHVTAELQLCCQRCMQPMSLLVDVGFALSLVEGLREAETLPEEYEPLLLEERLLRPMDLVEDELILAIPPVPRHEAAECGVDLKAYRETAQTVEPTQRENPFAALKQLKGDS